jgi:uncharacterized protein YoxC
MSTTVELSLVLLIFVLIAAIIVVSVYLVRLLIDLNVLTKNVNETTNIVKNDIEPILDELQKTLSSINTMVKDTDDQITSLKKILAAVFGFSTIFCGHFGKISGGFLKGFKSAFSFFRKK